MRLPIKFGPIGILLAILCMGCGQEEPDCPTAYDADGDGYWTSTCGTDYSEIDCNDGDESIHPDALERCDDNDQDCDGIIDEDALKAPKWYVDYDGDTYGIDDPADPDDVIYQCEPVDGRVTRGGDCNDQDDQVSPEAAEVCNEVDDNCNGKVDEDTAADAVNWHRDEDGDGYGDPDVFVVACTGGEGDVQHDFEGDEQDVPYDCDDTNPDINPGIDFDDDDTNDEIIYDAATGVPLVDKNCDGEIWVDYEPELGVSKRDVSLGFISPIRLDIPKGATAFENDEGEEVFHNGLVRLNIGLLSQAARDALQANDHRHPYLGTALRFNGWTAYGEPLELVFPRDGLKPRLTLPFDTSTIDHLLHPLSAEDGEPFRPLVDDECSDWVGFFQLDPETRDILGHSVEVKACSYERAEVTVEMDHFSEYVVSGNDARIVFAPVYDDEDLAHPDGPKVVMASQGTPESEGEKETLERRFHFYILGEDQTEGLSDYEDCLHVQAYGANSADNQLLRAERDLSIESSIEDGAYLVEIGLGYDYESPSSEAGDSEPSNSPPSPIDVQLLFYFGEIQGREGGGSCRIQNWQESICPIPLSERLGADLEETRCSEFVIDEAGGLSPDGDGCGAACELEGIDNPSVNGCYDWDGYVEPNGIFTYDMYACMDIELHYDPESFDDDGDGFSEDEGDCDDTDPEINPDATDDCTDGEAVDQNCDGYLDEDGEGTVYFKDSDGDKYGLTSTTLTVPCGSGGAVPDGYVQRGGDCNDSESSIHPGAEEVKGDNVDQDCDGLELCFIDEDGDGYKPTGSDAVLTPTVICNQTDGRIDNTSLDGDCCDARDHINPEGVESCDPDLKWADEDCSEFRVGMAYCGSIDDGATAQGAQTWYPDRDGDGYGDNDSDGVLQCWDTSIPEGTPSYALIQGDCDDDRWDVKPLAEERCDGIDNDCNDLIDDDDPGVSDQELYIRDVDGDDYGDRDHSGQLFCLEPPSHILATDPQARQDCDDFDVDINPGATEVCDGDDNDCDGEEDEEGASNGSYYFPDDDGDGDGLAGTEGYWFCPDDVPASGYSGNDQDCNDSDADIHVGASERRCNGEDDNCSGTVDEAGTAGERTVYRQFAGSVAWYSSLQRAVDDAKSGDTITVCEGTTHRGGISIVNKSGLVIQSSSGSNSTRPIIQGLNFTSAVEVVDSDDIELTRLVLADTTACKGAGLRLKALNQGSGPRGIILNDCTIRNNRAQDSATACEGDSANPGRGGGVFCNDCEVIFVNTDVRSNNADDEGGNLYIRDNSTVVFSGGQVSSAAQNNGVFINAEDNGRQAVVVFATTDFINNSPNDVQTNGFGTCSGNCAGSYDWDGQNVTAICGPTSDEGYTCN